MLKSITLSILFLGVITTCLGKPHHKGRNHGKPIPFLDDAIPLEPLHHEEKVKEKVKDIPVSHDTKKSDDLDWNDWDIIEDVKPKNDKKVKSKSYLDEVIDPCKDIYCHFGRICEVNRHGKGECVCGGDDYCLNHKKEVCGTDGFFYPSHCELHRIACVKKMHIGIDHSNKMCQMVGETKTLDNVPEKVHVRVEHVVKDGKKENSSKEETVNETKEEPEEEQEEKEGEEKQDFLFGHTKTYEEEEPPCEDLEYERLKSNLIQYHCTRIGEINCSEDDAKKQFVANIMFNYYDRNTDHFLDEFELDDIEHRDHLDKLSEYCGLTDMLTYDDKNEDGNITLNEFYKGFRIPTVILDESLKSFTTQLTVGNSIELKCDIKGATEIIWKRNGALLEGLATEEIKVFDDGSLYINNLALHHLGNYTCQDRYNDHVVQNHILRVQMAPIVKISPVTQFHTTGSSVTLRCHVDGIPDPEISWEMNEMPIPDDPEGKHYSKLHSDTTLEIKTATYTTDTGAYKCKARNTAGTSQDIATVFIENAKVPKYSEGVQSEAFVVFHDKGYTVYEPSRCHIEHLVSSSFDLFKRKPDYATTINSLCSMDQPCSWGHAVNVANKFIYITQPKLNRVVVIEVTDRINPVEVITTDKVPVGIQYVEHLDQVWVLCWNKVEGSGSKTSVVIRQASEDKQHHIVHTQPIANRFDLVKDIFLPPSNDLKHKFDHGYVVHSEQNALFKIDLQTMTYVKTIDLKDDNCVPESVAFIPLGGQIMIHCTGSRGESFQLVLDYITDTKVGTHELSGDSYVSPDGRHVVVLDDNRDTLTVLKVKDDGTLQKMYDEYTNLHISDITFFPAEKGKGYDFYASSMNKNDVLYICLASGKVEMIEGVGQAMDKKDWLWGKDNRVIVSGGTFGEYLMTPSKDSVFVIDGRRRHVQCEWQDILHGNVIVWVQPHKL